MKRRIRSFMMACSFALFTILTVMSPFLSLRVYADDAEGPILKIHYHREDGDYAPWDVWLWESGKDGAGYAFEDEDGEKVATMNVTPGTMTVGFIVRTQEWTKDIDADQFIDISDVVTGTVDIYIESGVEGYERTDRDDVVIGTKLKTAGYDGNGTVNVTMTAELEGELSEVFTILGSSGEEAIESVTYAENNLYKLLLTNPLDPYKNYTITYDGTVYKINMPILYSTDEFEQKFTYTGDDLGYTYAKEKTTFRVWAPTAEKVVLKRYESGTQHKDDLIEEVAMQPDANGTWVCTVNGDLNGTYYTYGVTLDGKEISAMDPYARSSGVNGKRAMVLDLDTTDPAGWDSDANPFAGRPINDAIIYETHIRDLTVGSDSGITNQGKFLGVVETGTKTSSGISTGLDHIKELGITHLHILPMYDFASLDETTKANGVYNWGYDPLNYNVPEGTYATDPYKGEVRVSELKQMVKGLHDNGIAVVMDVVYNHVYSAEDFSFNKIVPGYFSRITEEGTYSSGSGCGNDTATERSMVRKYIVDSVNYWADEYHIDGFRFDLVGLMDTELINEIVETVHKKHPDVLFYGEGWSLTTLVTKPDVTLATQTNSNLTPDFAYFNDTIRDGVKGSVFDTKAGFVSGASGCEAKIVRCFMGADKWCESPTQTINYVSCHDNNTLFDRLRLTCPDAGDAAIIKMNNLAASIYMLSEGIPFMQAGEEMLRTKTNEDGTFNSNSYSSPDSVNVIDWSSLEDESYKKVFDYYKGLISFRKAHPVLRLADAQEVSEHVKEVTGLESHMVAFDILGGVAGEDAEEMYVIYNANKTPQTVALPEGNWNVYIDADNAGNEALRSVEGEVSVDPVSALVLIKEDASKVNSSKDEEEPSPSGKSKTLPIVGGVGLAMAAGAAAALTVKKKKNK